MSLELYSWVILPLMIFIARIGDVSMETIRVIYISKGIKYLAPIIAFFEIVIWLLAMEVVMSDLSNIANFFAFAFGFAMGTYIGLVIEEKLSIGMVIVRIVTTGESTIELLEFLTSSDYGVTCLDGAGSRGTVKMILTLVNRTDLPHVIGHIRHYTPHAFFSVEDVRYVNEGVFRPKHSSLLGSCLQSFSRSGKKK
ncbi:MAG: DUF5698 domain-containing protein [Methanoregula sp.]|nr:DUF5698 domain-containing protein [Methanoregula sp.]